jgi:uncharacterized protein HemY
MNVMVSLAEHFVFNGDYFNAQKIARMILKINFDGRRLLKDNGRIRDKLILDPSSKVKANIVNSDELHSQLLYIIAKCKHFGMGSNDLKEAHRLYLSAIKLWPGITLLKITIKSYSLHTNRFY